MKQFLIKTTLFLAVIIASFAFMLSLADGSTDPFYIRFTTPKQDNLILGTSRSAQGLLPQVFDSALHKTFFNYSFTIAHSPYGPAYLNSIKRKLNAEIRDGIFIVTVDPWSIAGPIKNPNDTTLFGENNLALGNVNYVNMNPNFEYLIKQFKGEYYKIITTKKDSMLLHPNGWLEINVSMDSASVAKRLDNKIESYRKNNLPNSKLSTVRLEYLRQTVEFLKAHGKVYIVRLPVSPEIFEIDQALMPDFNSIIQPIVSLSDGYLDMTNDNPVYEYTDGNHLWKSSGRLVSQKVANWIEQN